MGLSNGFVSTTGGKTKTRVEDGTYMGRIVQIVDLGVQLNEYEGVTSEQQQVQITFEFPTERIEVEGESKPRWLGRAYKVSNHEKSGLYALLKAADPEGKLTNKGRNVKALLGLPVMITVGSTATGNAKVTGVARLMKGMTVPELENEPLFFDLDNPDMSAWDKLPQWLQEKIQGGVDFDPSILKPTDGPF